MHSSRKSKWFQKPDSRKCVNQIGFNGLMLDINGLTDGKDRMVRTGIVVFYTKKRA